jgi:hypothetical protein
MHIAISLAPIAVLAALAQFASVEVSLWSAAIVAIGLLFRDLLAHAGSILVLDAGTTVLFGALALVQLA